MDIVAQVPALDGTASAGGNAGRQDDLVNAMLRLLITERFKLESHQEDRLVTAYTLRAGKPKLRNADPSNRTGCLRGGTTSETAEPAASRVNTNTFDCQNMTMAQFAKFLQYSAFTNLSRASVLDATGLDGAWDFTLTFSPITQTTADATNDNGTGDSPVASTPTGRITLFEAIESQLGLKLETTKRPGQVLVIDHIEQKPVQ